MEEEKREQEKPEEKIEPCENAENCSKNKKKDKKEAKLEEKISFLEKEVDKWKNSYYRSYADTENLRKELEKDYREALKYRLSSFIEDLIPALDAFDAALGVEVTDEKLKNYLLGFTYIHNNLLNILEKEGIKVLDTKVGEVFDERTMHAIEVDESEESEKPIVKEIKAKGYKLHDHLLRPILVKVTKAKEISKEKKLDA